MKADRPCLAREAYEEYIVYLFKGTEFNWIIHNKRNRCDDQIRDVAVGHWRHRQCS